MSTQNFFLCGCFFYNLKVVKMSAMYSTINCSIFFSLKKIRKTNKVFSYKINANKITIDTFLENILKNFKSIKYNFKLEINKVSRSPKFFFMYPKRKIFSKSISQSKLHFIKNILFTERFFLNQNIVLVNFLIKFLIILKPLFYNNSVKFKIELIQLFCVISQSVNVLKILDKVRLVSCLNNLKFKNLYFKIIFSALNFKSFIPFSPYLRTLRSSENSVFSVNLLFFIVKSLLKNVLKIFTFELQEIFLILKKSIKSKNSKAWKFIFLITQNLFNFRKSKLFPKIENLNHGLIYYVRQQEYFLLHNHPKNFTLLLKNFKPFNTSGLIYNFIDFVRKYWYTYCFKLKEKISNLFLNYLRKNLLFKQHLLEFFFFRESKLRFYFSQMGGTKLRTFHVLSFQKIIVKLKKKTFEKFYNLVISICFLKRNSIKIDILIILLKENKLFVVFYSKKIMLEFFKYIFFIINQYSIKGLKKVSLLKKVFKLLHYLILQSKEKCRPFLGEVSGLLKWSFNCINPIIRRCAAKVMLKLLLFFYFFKEKILIGHFGLILVNNLNEKNPTILKYFIQSLRQIIAIFPTSYCIPPIRVIFSNIIPLLRNKNVDVVSELIWLVYEIIDKEWVFIPKKDFILLCFNLLKIQKNLTLKNRKFSMQILGKITKIYGTNELTIFLINSLEKSSGVFRLSLIVTLTTIAYEQRLHLVLPTLYDRYFKFKSNSISCVYKTLIYILEYVNSYQLSNYLNSLGIMIEHAVFDEKDRSDPLLLLLIGKFSQKFKFLGFEKKLIFLLKFVLVNSLICSKNILRYMLYAFEKLLTSLNPIVWWNFVFQGLTHRRKKIRVFYWKLQKIVNLNKNLSFFFLKFIMGSKKGLSRISDFNF